MVKMTYNEALAIQKTQMDFYSGRYANIDPAVAAQARETITAATKPCSFNPDEPVSAVVINRLVPRGGDIEKAFGINQGAWD